MSSSTACPKQGMGLSGHGSLFCQAHLPAQSKVRVCLGVGHCFVKLNHLPSYLGMNHCLVKLNFCSEQSKVLSWHGSLLFQTQLPALIKVRVCLGMGHCSVRFTCMPEARYGSVWTWATALSSSPALRKSWFECFVKLKGQFEAR